MSETITIDSLKALFRFPFQGRGWQNRFLVGTALVLAGFFIPILPLIFVGGYALAVIRQAVKGEELAPPAWDDWGRLGLDGLRSLLVGTVYTLPGGLVLLGGWLFYMASAFASAFLNGGRTGGGDATSGLLMLAAIAVVFLSMAVGTLLLLLAAIPLPAAMAHLVAKDRVGAAFAIREWWPLLWANKLGYFVAWVIVAGLYTLLYSVIMVAYYSLVLCCFIPFLAAPTTFYLLLVGAGLFGVTYRQSRERPATG